METPSNCPRCSADKIIKYGSVKGKRRWQCKACLYSFTRTIPRGKPPALKALAIALYGHGLSFRAIGSLFSVSSEAVRLWVETFASQLQL